MIITGACQPPANGASGRFDRLKEVALAYAFALKIHDAALL